MNKDSENFRILTAQEAAALLCVKLCKLYQFMKKRNLPYVEFYGAYTFIEESIINWKTIYDKQEAERKSMLKAQSVSKLLRVSLPTVYELAKKDKIPCHKEAYGTKQRYYFKRDEVINWYLSKEKNRPAEQPAQAQPAEQPEQAQPAQAQPVPQPAAGESGLAAMPDNLAT